MKKNNEKNNTAEFTILLRVIRATVPSDVRAAVGVWIVNKLSGWWPMVQLYTRLLYGRTAKRFRPVGKGNVAYDYKGRDIIAPRNAIPIFIEIFHEDIYDKTYEPHGVIVDIGAFVGMYAIKAAFSARKVIAVEPCPQTFEMLKSNCQVSPI